MRRSDLVPKEVISVKAKETGEKESSIRIALDCGWLFWDGESIKESEFRAYSQDDTIRILNGEAPSDEGQKLS